MLNLGNGYVAWQQRESSSLKLQSTHWDRDKIDASSQTTYSNSFSWMNMVIVWSIINSVNQRYSLIVSDSDIKWDALRNCAPGAPFTNINKF